jgi:hypothetical protein
VTFNRATSTGVAQVIWEATKTPFANSRKWPGRAKAELKLAAVSQSSKASQQGKF